ncbi:MAG: chorismate synthase, partial [Armatimonadetes bacterium CG07_land_8_20_14_0_80_40_9]
MFTFLTAGESHGKCLTAIIEGVVSGLSLNEEYINAQLKRRQVGFGRGERMKIEEDKVEITSGVRQGKTLGSPITLVIKNKDWENWKEVMSEKQDVRRQKTEDRGGLIITTPRPGHADLAGLIKYQQEDIRNILERSSARETAVRSAVGAVAKRLLEEFGLEVLSWVSEIGGVRGKSEVRSGKSEVKSQRTEIIGYRLSVIREFFQRAEESVLRCPDKVAERKMIEKIKSAKREGDTLGGIFEVVAIGAPVGLGSYVHWERRLDGRLARALMSIPAIKGVEIGLGFALSSLSGSEVHDEIFYKTDVRSQKS